MPTIYSLPYTERILKCILEEENSSLFSIFMADSADKIAFVSEMASLTFRNQPRSDLGVFFYIPASFSIPFLVFSSFFHARCILGIRAKNSVYRFSIIRFMETISQSSCLLWLAWVLKSYLLEAKKRNRIFIKVRPRKLAKYISVSV